MRKRQSPGTCSAPFLAAQNLTLDKCSQGAFPECIRKLYQIPKTNSSQPGNSFGIYEFNQTYVQSDDDLFFEKVAPEVPVGTTPTNILINGVQLAKNFTNEDGESNFDFQLAWPLVYPQDITLFDALPSQAQINSINSSNLPLAQVETLGFVDTLDDVLGSFDGVRDSHPFLYALANWVK